MKITHDRIKSGKIKLSGMIRYDKSAIFEIFQNLMN